MPPQPPLRRPFSVQVFLTRRVANERQYLIFLRRERRDLGLPAFYQGVSGALEHGESFLQAAIREVLEETALTIKRPDDIGFSHDYPIKEQWRRHYGTGPEHVEERIFTAQIQADAEPLLSAEHSSWQWLSLIDALPLLGYGANAQCLRRVEQFWSGRPDNPGYAGSVE